MGYHITLADNSLQRVQIMMFTREIVLISIQEDGGTVHVM